MDRLRGLLHYLFCPSRQVKYLNLAVPCVTKAKDEVDCSPYRRAAALFKHQHVGFRRIILGSNAVHDLIPIF